jgi:broad specificity phosphatase PhoE
VSIELVYETHSTTLDNEQDRRTGWLPGELSELGERQARELGERRRDDGIAAVLSSDLARAVDTARIAFAGTAIPLLLDWRLRECDYGRQNGMPRARMDDPRSHLDVPYPGGESCRQAIARVGRFVDDLPPRWDGRRILVIGHVATHWGLDHALRGTPSAELVGADFVWQPGWEYRA